MRLKGMLQKSGALLMSAAMLCTGAAVLPALSESGISARAYNESDYVTRPAPNSTTEAYVTNYVGNDTKIVIPSKIDGDKIIGIGTIAESDEWWHLSSGEYYNIVYRKDIEENPGRYGFYEYSDYLRTFEEVVLPNTVKVIEDRAFFEMRGLKKVKIPEGVKKIGHSSFAFCSSLTDLTIPSTVESIGGESFKGCSQMKTITFKSEKITKQMLENSVIGYNNYPLPKNTKFYGYKGSAVEQFVKDHSYSHSYRFRPLPVANLNKTAMSLGKGETAKLTATVTPNNVENNSITWVTSDPKVVTVDQKGNIKAVNTGTAWVTAKTVNGKDKSCKVTVKNAPSKITLTKGIVTIGVGEKFTLGSSVPNGSACSKRTYRSSNSSIVKMTRTDWQGDFVGVKPGVAYVTVRSYNGKESTCKVTVKKAPSKVTISKKAITLKVGQTASLSAAIPSDAGCAARTFRTSNSSVVKMTKTNWTGSFKAMKKGTAYVTVRTYNGKESSCKVTVI